MRNRTAYLSATVASSILVLTALPAGAAYPPVKAQDEPPEKSAKPMVKKEPMAGEMKKDGMMKEDVSKAEKKWSKEMDEKMKREKMK